MNASGWKRAWKRVLLTQGSVPDGEGSWHRTSSSSFPSPGCQNRGARCLWVWAVCPVLWSRRSESAARKLNGLGSAALGVLLSVVFLNPLFARVQLDLQVIFWNFIPNKVFLSGRCLSLLTSMLALKLTVRKSFAVLCKRYRKKSQYILQI